jgi:XTP/dITP diphosphohydrolase
MPTLVLATRSTHKLAELGRLLAACRLEALPAGVALPAEEGATYAENALAKARVAHAATGLPSIGDDSGIEAAALGGAPGVRSARFAGTAATDEQNLARLLAEVGTDDDRRAAFVCVLAHVVAPGGEVLFEGRCEGRLTREPRGEGGFGYDPIFVPSRGDDNRTMAELSPTEKDAISHRGRAARLLASHLAGEAAS